MRNGVLIADSRHLAVGSLFLAVLLASAADKGTSVPHARSAIVVSDQARRIHNSALVIDGHNDLPWELRTLGKSSFHIRDLAKSQPDLHTDIPRLRKGGLGAQFWAAYVPTSAVKRHEAVKMTIEQIDVIHRMVRRYSDDFELVRTAADIPRIRAAGKIASMIGVEGGHSIDDSLAVLRMYYAMGVRYMTLTHSDNTNWADSATDKPVHNGLAPFGEQVVREMNRLGMLVDISHVSTDTMRAAIRVSRAPVIASHSSARALADHPRNVPDDVLRMIAKSGGVVMVNFFPGFITPEGAHRAREMFDVSRRLRQQFPLEADYRAAMRAWRDEHPISRGSVHNVVDHIEHIIKVAGIDHVGLGSDFDGITAVPVQLEDVSCYPNITQSLLDRGFSETDIRKVLGENLLRVMHRAEAVARELPIDS